VSSVTSIPLTLVSGGSSESRERAIASMLPSPSNDAAVVIALLEDIPSGQSALDDLAIQSHRIANCCPCCIGTLPITVTLNKILRQSPTRIYLGLASSHSVESIKKLLKSMPYNDLIVLDKEIQCNPS
jgi:hypothetical protein